MPTITLSLSNLISGIPGVLTGGAWDDTTTAATTRILGVPGGAPVELSVTETNAAADYDVLLGTWVSPPVQQAGDIANASNTRILFARRSTSGAELRARYRLYVLDPDGAIRGSLYNKAAASALFNETASPVGLEISTTVTAGVTVQRNDRIVMEIGYRQAVGTATAATGSIWAGGTDNTPMVAGGTDINDPGFVEFEASTDLFAPLPAVAAGFLGLL